MNQSSTYDSVSLDPDLCISYKLVIRRIPPDAIAEMIPKLP